MANSCSSCPRVSVSPTAGIADIPQHVEDAAASLCLFLAGRQEPFQEGTDGEKRRKKKTLNDRIISVFPSYTPGLVFLMEERELEQSCPGKGEIFLPSTLENGF